MGKIIVWECPETGKIFRTRPEYCAFRSKQLRQKRAEHERAHRGALLDEQIAAMRNVSSTAHLLEWLQDHATLLAQRVVLRRKDCHLLLKVDDIRFAAAEFESLSWTEFASTKNVAPEGHPLGVAGDDTKPLGLPGWTGRFRYKLSGKNAERLAFDMLQGTRIRIGSGSGIGVTARFNVTLFEADFPIMSFYRRLHAAG